MRKLFSGFIFGLIFGFLLQKAGVADFDVLIGALRLTDFTVMKVIGSAIVSGGVSAYILRRLGLIELQLRPTHYASNAIGGLVFGLGFGICGYCPGTGGAALGQGSWDAGCVMLGMAAGSYLYAMKAPFFKRLEKIGDRGRVSLLKLVYTRIG